MQKKSQSQKRACFKSTYQYQGIRSAQRIKDTVFANFIFPCWADRFKISIKQSAGLSYFNMVDKRTFEYSIQTLADRRKASIELSFQDQQEFKQMETLKDHQDSLSQDIDNYQTEKTKLLKTWDKFIQQKPFLKEDEFMDTVEQGSFLVYLFETIFQPYSDLEKKYKTLQFFLLHYSKDDLQIDQKTASKKDISLVYVASNDKDKENTANEFKPYKIVFEIDAKWGKELSYDTETRYHEMPENKNVEIIELNFELSKDSHFFKQQLSTQASTCFGKAQGQRQRYYPIEPILTRNKVLYPYQEGKFQKNRIYSSKHFHLAFQGGGAKGLAYVGAYRSIRQMQDKYKAEHNQELPIKSIMGSSAGGIIALAISTGIPEYQLQKICYKMNAIPSTDRFAPNKDPKDPKMPNDQVVFDEYGNQIEVKTFITNIMRLISQYVNVQEEDLVSLWNKILPGDKWNQVQNKLLRWLALNMPAIAEILTIEQPEKPVSPEPGFFGKIGNLFKSEPPKLKRSNFNWTGLLMHGALMKGEAIHDIAKDCFVKFFIKKRLDLNCQIGSIVTFNEYLFKCLREDTINKRLTDHFKLSLDLLKMDLFHLKKRFESQRKFTTFVVCLVNTFIDLIDRFLKLDSYQGLIITDLNINILKLQQQGTLLDYFIHSFKKKNVAKTKQVEQRIKQLQFFARYGVNDQTGQGIQQMIQGKPIQFKPWKLSYSELNSILKCTNFIEPVDCSQVIIFEGCSIIKLINTVFGRQAECMELDKMLKKIIENNLPKVQDNRQQVHQLFFALQAAQDIFQLFNSFSKIQETVKKQHQNIDKQESTFEKYHRNIKDLKEKVKNINMQQYYLLTRVELTCTSVDLDSKILRFFNHKTTPGLPVCRAVQMTGSFPVGFKAQKWRKEWGKYHVYLLEHKMELDITGHEFTDGGLLANFPIKYMDNQEIRKRYFSHKAVKDKTILLGFGLDYVDESRYQPSVEQARKKYEQQKKSAILMKELQGLFFNINGLISGLKVGLTFKSSTVIQNWAALEHYLMKQIPLLRFGLKIMQAYPNSDRNLNMQTFENKLLKQELIPRWQSKQDKDSNQEAIGVAFFKESLNQFEQHISKQYQKNKSSYNIDNCSIKKNVVGNQIKNRQIESKAKISAISSTFLKAFGKGGSNMLKALNQSSDKLTERQLSLRLIRIFYTHLKMPKNKEIAQFYNRLYLFLRFIAYNEGQQSSKNAIVNPDTKLDVKQQLDIRPEFNKLVFKQLFNLGNYKEIEKHLSFKDYAQNMYKDFASKPEKDYEGIQSKKLKEGLEKLSKYNKVDFVEEGLFNITDELRRATQLVYLLIRGRNKNNQLDPSKLPSLREHIKNFNYQKLLYSQLRPDDSRKVSLQPGFNPLEYYQVIRFLQQEFKALEDAKKPFGRTKWFQNFLKLPKLSKQESQKNPEKAKEIWFTNICEHYLQHLLSLEDSEYLFNSKSQVNEQSKYKDFTTWYEDQYDFIKNEKVEKQLKYIMMANIRHRINSNRLEYSNIAGLLGKYLNFGKDSNKGKQYYKSIDQFLLFVTDEQISFKASQKDKLTVEHEQRLMRMKDQIIDILFKASNGGDFNYFFNKDEKNSKKLQKNKQLQRQQKEFIKPIKAKMEQVINKNKTDKKVQQYFQQWKKQANNKQGTVVSILDDLTLKAIELDTIKWYLEGKLQEQQSQIKGHTSYFGEEEMESEDLSTYGKLMYYETKKKNMTEAQARDRQWKKQQANRRDELRKLCDLNKEYFKEIKLIFQALKQSILLAILITEKQPKQQARVDRIISDKDIKKVFEDNSIHERLANIYKGAFQGFVKRYYELSEMPLNMIDRASLGNAFILEYKCISQLAHLIYPLVRDIHQCLKRKYPKYPHQDTALTVVERSSIMLYNIFAKINRYKFALPLLDVDWQICQQSSNQYYQKRVTNILLLQINKKIDDFSQTALDLSALSQQNDKEPQHKLAQAVASELDHRVHLILQGIQYSNEYFGGLYQNIDLMFELLKLQFQQRQGKTCQKVSNTFVKQTYANQYLKAVQKRQGALQNSKQKFQKDSQKKPELELRPQKIKMITCSNFHSIFGFLLTLGLSHEQIRRQMYKVAFKMNVAQNAEEVQEYFNSLAWVQTTAQSQKQLLKYLEKEHLSFFERLQTMKNQKYTTNSMQHSYNEMKLLFEHQKGKIMTIYESILDETTSNIQYIGNTFEQTAYAREIAKRFGFNYTCDLEKEEHKYDEQIKESMKNFRFLAANFFDLFGSLIDGILANNLVQSSSIQMNKENASKLARGLLVHRLLTTFKLREYIQEKLVEARLSPSITLGEYYEVSKRKVFLNFTVIDINRERLTFLNKNTTPNMPLGAAIISTARLPFLHTFFESNKEWEAPQVKQFHDFFIREFFKGGRDSSTSRFNKYLSGNLISSLPLELLTNKTIKGKLYDEEEDKELTKLRDFAICFNPSFSNQKIVNLPVRKDALNLGARVRWLVGHLLSSVPGGLTSWSGNKMSSLIRGDSSSLKLHNNNVYHHYNPLWSWTLFIGAYFQDGTLLKTISTLTNSNDNLILQWYYDKLIKLPIKIGTLEFNEIVDPQILEKYKVNIPSEKAHETVQRSYQITKTFIHRADNRAETTVALQKKDKETILSLLDTFKVKIRVELFNKPHATSGFPALFFKLSFLNHSPWNQNKYSCYLVQYCVEGQSTNLKKNDQFSKMKESEIIWMLENNTKIKLKFFYLLQNEYLPQATEQAEQVQKDKLSYPLKRMDIRQTEFELDFQKLVDKPVGNSYDYEFTYGWRSDLRTQVIPDLSKQVNGQEPFMPTHRNKEPLSGLKQPEMYLTLIKKPQGQAKHRFIKWTQLLNQADNKMVAEE